MRTTLRLGRALTVLAVLAATVVAVLSAHGNALRARVAQTTLVEAGAALERNLAIGQLSTPAAAAEARRNALVEVEELIVQLRSAGVADASLAEVDAALVEARSGGSGREAATSFSMLQSSLYRLEQDMDVAAEAADRRVKLGMIVIMVGAGVVLGAIGTTSARRSRRLAAEAAQRETEQAQEARLRLLAQHASDVVCLVDPDTTVLYTGPNLARVLGHEPDASVGLPLLDLVADADREKLLVAISDAVGRPSGSVATDRLAVRLRHGDGTEVPCEVVVVNLLAEPALGGLVVTIYDVSERHDYEARLATAAFYDPVTSLPNRELLLDRAEVALKRAVAGGESLGLILLEIEGLGAIQSAVGRAGHDEVVAEIARRCTSIVRDGGTVAHLGGGQFALLSERADRLDVVATRLIDQASAPIVVAGEEIACPARAGLVVVGDGDAPAGASALLDRAATAVQMAETGHDTVQTWHPAMGAEIEAELRLTSDLRRALDAGDQLFVEYQPSFALRTGEVVSAEALVRWMHPTRGRLSPAVFIPLAERSGLIVPLDQWVLRTACAEAATWPVPDGGRRASVSVNVTASQLARASFVHEVADALESSGLEHDRLVLEITESAVLGDVPTIVARLERVRALGVRLAIDDFGTGYSSLSYVQQLPVDILKIDKAFVDRIATTATDADLAGSILSMARNLGLTTVAEGIEDADQAGVLRSLGYDVGQGFLWARPLPTVDLHPVLSAGRCGAPPRADTAPTPPSTRPTETSR